MPQPHPSTAPASHSAAAPAAAACENCGAVLQGRFCHACGQPAEPPATSVRAFVRQAAADITNLDSRILRPLGLLLARPGRLTREYIRPGARLPGAAQPVDGVGHRRRVPPSAVNAARTVLPNPRIQNEAVIS
jgi:hypothetical protein